MSKPTNFHCNIALVETFLLAATPFAGSSTSPALAPAHLYPAQLSAGTSSAVKGQGSHTATAALGKGLAKLFTSSQHTIPLLFVLARQWVPAAAERCPSDMAGINLCEWANSDFPGGHWAPNSIPSQPQVPGRERCNASKPGNSTTRPPKPQGAGVKARGHQDATHS